MGGGRRERGEGVRNKEGRGAIRVGRSKTWSREEQNMEEGGAKQGGWMSEAISSKTLVANA